MREILFRGKRADNGEWVYGYYVFQKKRNGCFGQTITDADFDIHYIVSSKRKSFDVIPETVVQYTGLTDKNGTKIFEGDIFKFDDEVYESIHTWCGTEYNSYDVENCGVIGFDDERGCFDFVKYKFDENLVDADLHENNCMELYEFISDLEVIGNILDNPELLKECESK